MFENSQKLIADCGLTWLHVFPYSQRPGTPAARMPQVDRAAIKDRAARLRAAGDSAVTGYLASLAGDRTGGVDGIRNQRPKQRILPRSVWLPLRYAVQSSGLASPGKTA